MTSIEDKDIEYGAITSLKKESAISFIINIAFSIIFFIIIFGFSGNLISWSEPDNLSRDFIPQSIAVCLMSSLVPALVLRTKIAKTHGKKLALRGIFIVAGLLAASGTVLGILLKGASSSIYGDTVIAMQHAVLVKAVYGGLLGASMTAIALYILLGSARREMA